MELAAELIKLAAVGLVAGLFSSLLANRDYRYWRWWELRVGAYRDAIEALSDIVYYYDNTPAKPCAAESWRSARKTRT